MKKIVLVTITATSLFIASAGAMAQLTDQLKQTITRKVATLRMAGDAKNAIVNAILDQFADQANTMQLRNFVLGLLNQTATTSASSNQIATAAPSPSLSSTSTHPSGSASNVNHPSGRSYVRADGTIATTPDLEKEEAEQRAKVEAQQKEKEKAAQEYAELKKSITQQLDNVNITNVQEALASIETALLTLDTAIEQGYKSFDYAFAQATIKQLVDETSTIIMNQFGKIAEKLLDNRNGVDIRIKTIVTTLNAIRASLDLAALELDFQYSNGQTVEVKTTSAVPQPSTSPSPAQHTTSSTQSSTLTPYEQLLLKIPSLKEVGEALGLNKLSNKTLQLLVASPLDHETLTQLIQQFYNDEKQLALLLE